MPNVITPNPDVYLNHLPPDEAKQFEIARNIYIAITGVSVPQWSLTWLIEKNSRLSRTIFFHISRMISELSNNRVE